MIEWSTYSSLYFVCQEFVNTFLLTQTIWLRRIRIHWLLFIYPKYSQIQNKFDSDLLYVSYVGVWVSGYLEQAVIPDNLQLQNRSHWKNHFVTMEKLKRTSTIWLNWNTMNIYFQGFCSLPFKNVNHLGV